MSGLAHLHPGDRPTYAFHDATSADGISLSIVAMANVARAISMKDRNSKSYITLQPPAGFHTSRPDGAITLSDGTPLKPDLHGFYYLDRAHAHLLRTLVAQGWHAPRAEMRTPRYARDVESAAHGDMLDTAAILKLASGEQVDLTVKDGRMLMRGEPSARLLAHLRGASISLREELQRRTQKPWIEV